MSDEPEIYFNNTRLNSVSELNSVMDAWQDSMVEEERRIIDELEVSPNTASAILYLRSRSRWTVAKEQELISRDRAGNPIPLGDVLSGEF